MIRSVSKRALKVRIGQAAVQLIRPHHNIILDSGTTTVQIARQIKSARLHPLTVITNAVNVAYELAENESAQWNAPSALSDKRVSPEIADAVRAKGVEVMAVRPATRAASRRIARSGAGSNW